MSEEDFHLSSQRTLRRTRDGPPGRLYKFAGLREIPNLVAASPHQENPCPVVEGRKEMRRRI